MTNISNMKTMKVSDIIDVEKLKPIVPAQEVVIAPKKVRAKKKVVGNEIVRSRKGHTRTNKPVKLPDNPTWIKQPNIITLMSYNFGTLNVRVLITVIEKIQSAVEESIHHFTKKDGFNVEQLDLFKEIQNTNVIRLEIQYAELGIKPNQYDEVRAALRQLVTIPVELDAIDPDTGEECWKLQGLLTANIPKKKGSRSFTVEMNKDVAKIFVTVDKGWTKFIKEVAFATDSKYTVRMYMLISKWKDMGGFQMNLDKFRKWLQLEDKYPKYKDLYKRVIRPAYEELFEKADCWFEMSESFRLAETEPYKLNFKVIKSALTEKEAEKLKLQCKNIESLCARYLTMTDKHIIQITPLVNLTNYESILNKINFLISHIKANYGSITNIAEYCTKALLSEFSQVPESIVGEEPLN
jgi:hypothetical protein